MAGAASTVGQKECSSEKNFEFLQECRGERKKGRQTFCTKRPSGRGASPGASEVHSNYSTMMWIGRQMVYM